MREGTPTRRGLVSIALAVTLLLGAVAVGADRLGYRPPDNQTIAIAVRALENRVARLEARVRRLERGR